jgi:hypothetical protein
MAAPRPLLLLAAALLSGCALPRGPKPVQTIPDAYRPDGTPVERTPTPPPVREIERPPPLPGYHFALLTDMQRLSIRANEGPFPIPDANPTLISFDATIQRAEGLGLGAAVRVIRGAGRVPKYAEGAVLFGTRFLALDAAIATRYGPHVFLGGSYDSLYNFFRVGARGKVNLGRSGFTLQVRGATYLDVPAPGTVEDDMRGWSTDTWLSWAALGSPVTLNLGYRREQFLVRTWRQETSALVLGTGVVLGRR